MGPPGVAGPPGPPGAVGAPGIPDKVQKNGFRFFYSLSYFF